MENPHAQLGLVLVVTSLLTTPASALAQSCQGWLETDLPSRSSHAMAYDSARGVTVVFGGIYADDETWEWSGQRWKLRASSGPSARYGHAMAYDSRRGVTVLFGGIANQNANG